MVALRVRILLIAAAVALAIVGAGATPVLAGGAVGLTDPVGGVVEDTGRVWAKVAGGRNHTCGVRTDRSLWCWGNNGDGSLGLGDTTDRRVPTRVGTDLDWAKIGTGAYHTCGVRADRSLWCWGNNGDGQLGLGDETNRLVPNRVGTDLDWVEISTGVYHTCGVRADRSLWCWGSNGAGQLGLGDTTLTRLVPTRVGTDLDWAKISTGADHTCGVRTDRSLWCWGLNDRAQLGLGDLTDRLVPTRV